jgi:DNA repair protein RecO (recombination protein O)
LKGIAKGARKANNKFGAALEPFSRVSLVIYKKENRDLHLISQCDCIESYRKLHDNLGRISAGLAVLELVDMLVHGEEENQPLFSLLVETLSTLNNTGKNFQSLQRAFQLKCAAMFGFAPSLEVCAACGRRLDSDVPMSHVDFQLMNGAIICSQCRRGRRGGNPPAQLTISAPALRVLQRFLSASTDRIPAVSYNDQIGNELDEALRLYLRYHFDHAKELMAVRLFKSIV